MDGIARFFPVLGSRLVTGPVSFAPEPFAAKDSTRIDLSERDREDAARLLAIIAGPKHDPIGVARAIISDRRRRELIFNSGMFGEPAWVILLTLFVMDQQGPRLTIGRLAQEARCAQTTALRWLEYLESDGLIVRQEHPSDARKTFVRLTNKAGDALREYLSQTATNSI